MCSGRVAIDTYLFRINLVPVGMRLEPSHGTFDIFDAGRHWRFLRKPVLYRKSYVALERIVHQKVSVNRIVLSAEGPATSVDYHDCRSQTGVRGLLRFCDVQIPGLALAFPVADVAGHDDLFLCCFRNSRLGGH